MWEFHIKPLWMTLQFIRLFLQKKWWKSPQPCRKPPSLHLVGKALQQSTGGLTLNCCCCSARQPKYSWTGQPATNCTSNNTRAYGFNSNSSVIGSFLVFASHLHVAAQNLAGAAQKSSLASVGTSKWKNPKPFPVVESGSLWNLKHKVV